MCNSAIQDEWFALRASLHLPLPSYPNHLVDNQGRQRLIILQMLVLLTLFALLLQIRSTIPGGSPLTISSCCVVFQIRIVFLPFADSLPDGPDRGVLLRRSVPFAFLFSYLTIAVAPKLYY